MPTLKFPKAPKRDKKDKEPFKLFPDDLPDQIRVQMVGAAIVVAMLFLIFAVIAIIARTPELLFIPCAGVAFLLYRYVTAVLPFVTKQARMIVGAIYVPETPPVGMIGRMTRGRMTRPYLYIREIDSGVPYKIGLNSYKDSFSVGAVVSVYYNPSSVMDLGDGIALINEAIAITVLPVEQP